jgi:uncharacterized protein (TIGR01777 family)
MARVVVTGATGLIGRAVVGALRDRGDAVVALSRDEARARERLGAGVEVHAWPDPTSAPPPGDALAGADAVVHLLGEPIDQRWSEETKRRLRDSRVRGTRMLVEALAALPGERRPAALVSQSASGYYGASDARPLDESSPAGGDFLARLVVDWEAEAAKAPVRVTRTRTGIVLSSGGGALSTMLPFFRLGLGGPVAGGRQYVPWIHLDDVVAAMLRAVDDPGLEGAINVTAPNPATNAELSHTLGRVLRRPAFWPVPGLAVKLLYGEMSQLVTTGARVVPARLQAAGHSFRHPQLEDALRDVLGG